MSVEQCDVVWNIKTMKISVAYMIAETRSVDIVLRGDFKKMYPWFYWVKATAFVSFSN